MELPCKPLSCQACVNTGHVAPSADASQEITRTRGKSQGSTFETRRCFDSAVRIMETIGGIHTYPPVNIQKAMENGHRNSGFSH